MMLQKEHTLCEDPLTDDAAVLSEFDLILLFSLVFELYGCLISIQICTHMQLQQTRTYDLNEM